MIRLLIDECLTPRLMDRAHKAGFEAHHVIHLGLAGASDLELFEYAFDNGFTVVTNNCADWLKLAQTKGFHAGLINILSNERGDRQIELFDAVLKILDNASDMTNRVVEVDRQGDIRTYDWPDP